MAGVVTPYVPAPRIDFHFPPPRPPVSNRLLFTGDVMLSRWIGRQMKEAHDPALFFRPLASQLAAADITFINLESPFSDEKRAIERGMVFRAMPETIAGLKLAGVDVASTANNHTRDCSAYGVSYTQTWLTLNGIRPLGTGESADAVHRGVVMTQHGVRFGFLGYTYDQQNGNWRDLDDRIAMLDPVAMARDVQAMKQRADVIIVSMHAGIEYHTKPSQQQIEFAHKAIDAGASLVVGHHPHVVQPLEIYRNRPIVYSLGNFIFDQFQRVETQHGWMMQVDFLDHHAGAPEIIPVQITKQGPVLESSKQ